MSQQNSSDLLAQLTLGKQTQYATQYDPNLLQAVPRAMSRATLGDNVPELTGVDIWTGYEVSWLEASGKPVVKIAEFEFNAQSDNLIESKSFKLYLNSFNQSQFNNDNQVAQIMQKDLSQVSGYEVKVKLFSLADYTAKGISELPGELIDDLPVTISDYEYSADKLKPAENSTIVTETLNSHLLKSNCLVTNQPDWGSVCISYTGPKIDHASLLTYIIGFRNHNEFHEHCVERIYTDINEKFKPQSLLVYARYTRRGGLDINPVRVSDTQLLSGLSWHRLARQ
ncbi:NADPH-dependent 7-cyano-7-deazaguanine reductase QueF [Catenovulum sp. 2E275]|uniref:NADPH-dependent 7-cyano-7-deazaguanine reductase QueF n=1 Tax=Catenovulum sp. 2E275 TaxID=2980497 RepID=UPI0021CE16EE|nr:NADPH-dependent 7-cyano-7-deazaguanine reductase QueF [Catenovulum sp. 2E275]MCU4676081.1 NADPH-dependent 7-cyano-7-deazaguanine reductase QueF [Catenovulum sp. 2E275]